MYKYILDWQLPHCCFCDFLSPFTSSCSLVLSYQPEQRSNYPKINRHLCGLVSVIICFGMNLIDCLYFCIVHSAIVVLSVCVEPPACVACCLAPTYCFYWPHKEQITRETINPTCMSEASYCIIFPVLSHPFLQFPHVPPSHYWTFPQGNIKLLSPLISSSSPPLLLSPWWEQTVVFQTPGTKRGGRTGVVGWKGGR